MENIYRLIKQKISLSQTEEALNLVDRQLSAAPADATLHYLCGTIHMKMGNYRLAMNSFLQAESLDPSSPAVEAKAMLTDIMNFFHKDLYNP